MDTALLIGIFALLFAIPPCLVALLDLIPKVKDNTFHILWKSEGDYEVKPAGSRYIRRLSEEIETIEISRANNPGRLTALQDRVLLDLVVAIETADYVKLNLGLKIHVLKGNDTSQLELLRQVPIVAALATPIVRNELSTISVGDLRESRLKLQETLNQKLEKKSADNPKFSIDQIELSQDIQYPSEVAKVLEKEKSVLLNQRIEIAQANFQNMKNRKRVETEIINREKLAIVDETILNKFKKIFAEDPKQAARYVLLMRYAHEAGRTLDEDKDYSPNDIIALVDQLDHQLNQDPAQKSASMNN